MKIVLKKIATKVIGPIALKLGYQKPNISKTKFSKNTLLGTVYKNLTDMGFSPKHIIDVGANRGGWTRETLLYFPNAYFTLLEPQEWLQSYFKDIINSDSKVRVHTVGAGAKSGSFQFTLVDRDDSCSFRYTKAEAESKGFKQIEVPVVTLNELIDSSADLPFPDMVKIDAEGLDIEVLQGASNLLGRTEVFMIEASVANKSYRNSVLKIVNFMDDKGYSLFDITDLNRPFKPEILWLVELVFVKKGGQIDSFNIPNK